MSHRCLEYCSIGLESLDSVRIKGNKLGKIGIKKLYSLLGEWFLLDKVVKATSDQTGRMSDNAWSNV
jgi:hypothetical protein